jgi:phosphopantetheine adenylyltransferase/dephospho-CoA kinase
LDHANKQIQILHEAGYQIIVMEAAVLLQAGWDQYVHEVWACIIPFEEVSTITGRKSKVHKLMCNERLFYVSRGTI